MTHRAISGGEALSLHPQSLEPLLAFQVTHKARQCHAWERHSHRASSRTMSELKREIELSMSACLQGGGSVHRARAGPPFQQATLCHGHRLPSGHCHLLRCMLCYHLP